jgi:Tfp pilus assembly protein FimT
MGRAAGFGLVDGFGLVEMLAGMAVLLTTVGIASTSLGGVVGSVRLSGAAERLASALRAARSEALARGRAVEVRFDPPRRTWSVREDGGALMGVEQLPAGVTFSSLPSSLCLRFTTIGTTDNGTVALAAGGRARRVVVNQRGRVRVQ